VIDPRKCEACGEEKPLTEYHRYGVHRRRKTCPTCLNEKERARKESDTHVPGETPTGRMKSKGYRRQKDVLPVRAEEARDVREFIRKNPGITATVLAKEMGKLRTRVVNLLMVLEALGEYVSESETGGLYTWELEDTFGI